VTELFAATRTERKQQQKMPASKVWKQSIKRGLTKILYTISIHAQYGTLQRPCSE